MMQSKSLVLLAGAALGLGGVNAVRADVTTSNDEVRAVVAEMLADAETRSSLLAGGDAGHDGRFFIAGDGFRLNVGGSVQFRYILNFRDTDTGNDFESGFQNRRTKLNFSGNINKDWFFRVEGNFSDVEASNGGIVLEDAHVGYRFANGVTVAVGQFKLPLLREELVADTKQLAAERSFTNLVFTQDWSQGVLMTYETESWRVLGAFSDGLASRNTDFNSRQNQLPAGRVTGEAEYAFTGRFEYLPQGNWKQFEDFTSPKGSDFGWLLGAAVHWQQSDNVDFIANPTPPPAFLAQTDRDTLEYTADISLKGDSWNLYGAFIGRYTKDKANASSNEFNDFGAVVQGGWRFAENTEVFARWDAVFFDSDRNFTDDSSNFVTFGINQYYAGHAAKATIDAIYSFQSTSDLLSGTGFGSDGLTGLGLLGEQDEGEVAVRFQFQLLF